LPGSRPSLPPEKPIEQPNHTSPSFAEDGYAVLGGFLDTPLLAELRPHLDAAIQAPPMPGCERPHNQLFPLRFNDPIVELVLQEGTHLQALKALTDAQDLRWISGYISTKEAHSRALWWHQDWWCWEHPLSFRPTTAQVAVLCYLEDTSEDNGALRVLPRSHHHSLPLHALLSQAHAQGDQLPPDHAVFSDQPGQITLGARAGDAIALDYRLLHGTHPNASTERRDCLLLSFTPSWSELPHDVRGHLIQHLAQPTADELGSVSLPWARLLPSFTGTPVDLPLNRNAPPRFDVHRGGRLD
jgi:hypothetical protein